MKYQETITSFFELLTEKNIKAWMELWEDDALCHFPYANKLFDAKLVGKTEIRDFWSSSPELYDSLTFKVKDIYKKGNTIVVFFQNHHKLKDEETIYNDLNIGVFKFSGNDKIQEYQEFFDSLNLGQIFKIIDLKYLDQ